MCQYAVSLQERCLWLTTLISLLLRCNQNMTFGCFDFSSSQRRSSWTVSQVSSESSKLCSMKSDIFTIPFGQSLIARRYPATKTI